MRRWGHGGLGLEVKIMLNIFGELQPTMPEHKTILLHKLVDLGVSQASVRRK